MKSIKIWSLIAMLFIGMVGCEPIDDNKNPNDNPSDNPNDNPNDNPGGVNNDGVIGEWVLVSWSEDTPPFHVYVDFNDDNTFEMYEQVYSLMYEYVAGVYHIDGNTLSGNYLHGEDWKSSYTVAFSENAEGVSTMELVDASGIKSIYEATTIPEDVKTEAKETRATGAEHFL